MAEIALVSSRKVRLEAEAKQGNARARVALELANSPNRFLSTVQIGITLIGIVTGVYSGSHLTTDLQSYLVQFEWIRPYSETVAVIVVVMATTYLSVVIGELLPKRIGLTNPEKIAKVMAGPMNWLSRITLPFIWLLSVSNDLLIRLLGIKPSSDNQVTEEEIKAIMQEGASEGTIEEIEYDIVKNVFSTGDKRLSSLMTIRRDIIWLDVEDSPQENQRKILEYKHTAYPVCRGSIDNVLGIIYLKDLLDFIMQGHASPLRTLKKDALFLPENSKAYHALEKFMETGIQQAIVVDEYGGVAGLITINDVFGALVQDISEEDTLSEEITPRPDGSYLIDAQLSFDEFARRFGIPNSERKELSGFNTLAGFVIHILHDIPKTGDRFIWKDHSFEIVDMDKSRIDKILYRSTRDTPPVTASV